MADLITDIRLRTQHLITNDRLRQGVIEPGSAFESGCAFFALAKVFIDFNPRKPIPRIFETEPQKYAPKLGINLQQFFNFVERHKDHLGYCTDELVIDATKFRHPDIFEELTGRWPRLESDESQYRSGIYDSKQPLILIGFDGNITRHMEESHGSVEQKEKSIARVRELGLSESAYITFKQLSN